uniref:Defensin n=1 Tax=Coridius chinensis TaxID=1028097 RepID=A0A650C417_CORCQ|nr:defensin [Coridius chinensis]
MKSLLILVAVAIVAVGAIPVYEQSDEFYRERRSLSQGDFEEIPLEEIPDHGLRLKRATCDLLSMSTPWLTVNHAACALHCLTMGHKGGRCVDAICNCRN